MRITEGRLRQIIREEVKRNLNEANLTREDWVEFARKLVIPVSPAHIATGLGESGEMPKFLQKFKAQYVDDKLDAGKLSLGLIPVSGGYDQFLLIELPQDAQSLRAVEVSPSVYERTFPDGNGFISKKTFDAMPDGGDRINNQVKNIKASWEKHAKEIDERL